MDETDRAILQLAAAHYRHEGFRVAAAKDRFGLGHTAFWQRVNHLIDDPDTMFAMPVETARLRRIRAGRQVQRRAS